VSSLVEEFLARLQIGGVEPFGKPVVNRLQDYRGAFGTRAGAGGGDPCGVTEGKPAGARADVAVGATVVIALYIFVNGGVRVGGSFGMHEKQQL
jgi:hypothetical protein